MDIFSPREFHNLVLTKVDYFVFAFNLKFVFANLEEPNFGMGIEHCWRFEIDEADEFAFGASFCTKLFLDLCVLEEAPLVDPEGSDEHPGNDLDNDAQSKEWQRH
jgi:hypothetical protein